jgi:hypothetical protein
VGRDGQTMPAHRGSAEAVRNSTTALRIERRGGPRALPAFRLYGDSGGVPRRNARRSLCQRESSARTGVAVGSAGGAWAARACRLAGFPPADPTATRTGPDSRIRVNPITGADLGRLRGRLPLGRRSGQPRATSASGPRTPRPAVAPRVLSPSTRPGVRESRSLSPGRGQRPVRRACEDRQSARDRSHGRYRAADSGVVGLPLLRRSVERAYVRCRSSAEDRRHPAGRTALDRDASVEVAEDRAHLV